MPSHRDDNYVRLQKSNHDQCPKYRLIDTNANNVRETISYNGLNATKFAKNKQQHNKTDFTNSQSISATQNEWLLDLCCLLQESALKALRLSNEKYESTLEQLRQQQVVDDDVPNGDNFVSVTI